MTGLLRRVIAWMQPVDLHTVCRDQRVVRAVERGDLDTARQLAPDALVDELRQLHALRGAA